MSSSSEKARLTQESEGIAAEADLDRKIEDLLNKFQDEAPGSITESPVTPRRYRSRRLGVLAQPLPRSDAKVSAKERKQIVKLLLLYHLTTAANADCMDEIVRLFYRDWPIARIAVWKYGVPPEYVPRLRGG